jgi:sugar phosphate isomerase/epimerase
MNIGISNLAFDNNDINILNYLSSNNINNVELVYTKHKLWEEPINNLDSIKNLFNTYNLNIYSIQSIFYGTEINSFNQVDDIKSHLNKLFNICKILGIKKTVFGSPVFRKSFNRYKTNIINIFDFIENELKNTDIKFLIEPNSKIYQTEYFYNPYEIFDFIKSHNYKNISSMIDTHNLILEGYDPISIFENNSQYIDHIHVSEVGLKEINDIDFHYKFSNTLKDNNYNKMIIYEILKNDNIIENIENFKNIYSNQSM